LVILAADTQPHEAVDSEHIAAVAAPGVLEDLDNPAHRRFANETKDPEPAVEPGHDLANETLGRTIDVARLLHHSPQRLPRRHFQRGEANTRALISHGDERMRQDLCFPRPGRARPFASL